jgi:hypothetical protein
MKKAIGIPLLISFAIGLIELYLVNNFSSLPYLLVVGFIGLFLVVKRRDKRIVLFEVKDNYYDGYIYSDVIYDRSDLSGKNL